MTAVRPLRLLLLPRDRRASVSLELAVIFPLVLVICLGFFELYNFIRTAALVERATSSLANMMARQTSSLVDCADSAAALNLGAYMNAATVMFQPVPLEQRGEIILSAVDWPSGQNTAPRVAWQRSSTFTLGSPGVNSMLGTQGTRATLPAGLRPTQGNGDTILVAEVFYRFTPFAMSGQFWSGTPFGEITIHRIAYYRARMAALNTLAAPVTPPGCAGVLPTPSAATP